MQEDPGEEGVEAAGRAFGKGSRWWEAPEVCGTWEEAREKPQSDSHSRESQEALGSNPVSSFIGYVNRGTSLDLPKWLPHLSMGIIPPSL